MHGPPSLAARPAEIALEGKSMNTNVAFLQLSRINIFRGPPSPPWAAKNFTAQKLATQLMVLITVLLFQRCFMGGLRKPESTPRPRHDGTCSGLLRARPQWEL